jgi:hypothetical protein
MGTQPLSAACVLVTVGVSAGTRMAHAILSIRLPRKHCSPCQNQRRFEKKRLSKWERGKMKEKGHRIKEFIFMITTSKILQSDKIQKKESLQSPIRCYT